MKEIKKKIAEKMKTPKKGEVTKMHIDTEGFGDTTKKEERRSRFSVKNK